jgi:hypothetical protein
VFNPKGDSFRLEPPRNRSESTLGIGAFFLRLDVNAISSLAASGAEPVRAGVINNTCHGYGRGPLSLVLITGSCRFSDNQYACASEKVEAVVDVTAEALIAAENRIECGRDARSLDVKLGNAKALTVLGNIVGGPIIINGAALGGPWQPLNVIGT